jgi:hypothetical protein
MFAVVIDRVGGDVAESARALAGALGKTPYEVRASLQLPGGGPAVVAVHAGLDAAEVSAVAVRAAAFTCSVIAVREPLPGLLVPRRFELADHELAIECRDGSSARLRYAEIEVLIRGMQQTQASLTATVTERKLDFGRAILSGGLVNTRTEKTTRTTTTTDSDEFLLLVGGGHSCSLREHELQYQSLGAALQPSRTANFRYLVTELYRRCSTAARDERLMRRSVQSQTLGPMLSPDTHLDLALRLVADSIRRR